MDLSHPSIIQIFDFVIEDDQPFLIMEYAPYGTLRTRHPKGSQLPLDTIIPYAQQIAAALHYIHEQKLIHRDVKPENMLLGKQQTLLLSDFGIASIAHTTGSLAMQERVGTPAYMAPEQIQGHPRAASDQYALGIMVYEWLCGQAPFQGTTQLEIAMQHLLKPPPSLCQKIPTLSSTVEHVVLKAIAKDPRARFSTITLFAEALAQAYQEEQNSLVRSPALHTHAQSPSHQSAEAAESSHLSNTTQGREVPQFKQPDISQSNLQSNPSSPAKPSVISRQTLPGNIPPSQQNQPYASRPTTLSTAIKSQKKTRPYYGLVILLVALIISITLTSFSMHWQWPIGGNATGSQSTMKKLKGQTPSVTTTATFAQAPVQILAQDTFQRTDQSGWGMASDARSWGGDANIMRSIFSIVHATGQVAHGQGAFNALLGPSTDNIEVVTSGAVNHLGANANFGVVARWIDNNNFYKAYIDGTHLTLLKCVKGTISAVSSVPFHAQDNTTYTLRLRTVGSTLLVKAWQSNTPEPANGMITATDVSLPTGQAGLRFLLENGTEIHIVVFSLFSS